MEPPLIHAPGPLAQRSLRQPFPNKPEVFSLAGEGSWAWNHTACLLSTHQVLITLDV